MKQPAAHPLNRGFAWDQPRGPFRRVTPEQARQYGEQGYFVLEDAFAPEALAARHRRDRPASRRRPRRSCAAAKADGCSSPAPARSPSARTSSRARRGCARSARGSVFRDLAHDLIGPDVRLYWDQAVYKKPGHPDDVPLAPGQRLHVRRAAAVPDLLGRAHRRHPARTAARGCVPGLHRRGTLAPRDDAPRLALPRGARGRRGGAGPRREHRGVLDPHAAPHRSEPDRGAAQGLHRPVRAGGSGARRGRRESRALRPARAAVRDPAGRARCPAARGGPRRRGPRRMSEAARAFAFAGGGLRATVSSLGATLVRLEVPDRGGRLERRGARLRQPRGVRGEPRARRRNRRALRQPDRGRALRARRSAPRPRGQRGPPPPPRRLAGLRPPPLAAPRASRSRRASSSASRARTGDAGYPGALACRVRYWIAGPGELAISFEARADRATPVSLTQHAYWNLGGPPGEPVRGHELEIAADAYLPVDAEHLPTGELRAVAGTPFDFRRAKPLGRDLEAFLRAPSIPSSPPTAATTTPSCCAAARARCAGPRASPSPAAGACSRSTPRRPACSSTAASISRRVRARQAGATAPPGASASRRSASPTRRTSPRFPPAILHPGEVHRQETRYRFGAA